MNIIFFIKKQQQQNLSEIAQGQLMWHEISPLLIKSGYGAGIELHNTKCLLKGEVQSRITIISKERVKISLQIGANMMKIG